MCLCPALRSRSGPHAHGPRPAKEATYCVHGGVGPPGVSRKSQTMYPLSRFNHAALTLAPYASRIPCGYAVHCSLPSGCQPFSGGSAYPLGIDYMFHLPFVGFLMFWLLARDPVGSTFIPENEVETRRTRRTQRRNPDLFAAGPFTLQVSPSGTRFSLVLLRVLCALRVSTAEFRFIAARRDTAPRTAQPRVRQQRPRSGGSLQLPPR